MVRTVARCNVMIHYSIFAVDYRAAFIAGARHQVRLACTTGDSIKCVVGKFDHLKVFRRFALLDLEFLYHKLFIFKGSTSLRLQI